MSGEIDSGQAAAGDIGFGAGPTTIPWVGDDIHRKSRE